MQRDRRSGCAVARLSLAAKPLARCGLAGAGVVVRYGVNAKTVPQPYGSRHRPYPPKSVVPYIRPLT